MPELQARLGSSPDGLSQAEAVKFLSYFWGPIPCEQAKNFSLPTINKTRQRFIAPH
jgi:hypothetical protein